MHFQKVAILYEYSDASYWRAPGSVSNFLFNPVLSSPSPLIFNNSSESMVASFTFLGTLSISNARCTHQPWTRKLSKGYISYGSKFRLPQAILLQLYTATVGNISTSAITIQSGVAATRDNRKLQCTIRMAEKIFSCSLSTVEVLYITSTKRRPGKIMGDTFHPAIYLFQKLPSGKWFCFLVSKTEPHWNSSFPVEISCSECYYE